MSRDWLNPEQRQSVLELFEELFGIDPGRFSGYRFLRRGDGVYAVGEDLAATGERLWWQLAGLRVVTVKKGGSLQPAARGMQVFGRWATLRVCPVDDVQLAALLRGASVPWEGDRGVRLLRWRGVPVGLGVIRAGQLVGQLPRNVTEHLQLQRMKRLC